MQIPAWADTEGWASGEPRVVDALLVGYPRFLTPRIVNSLASRVHEEWASKTGTFTAGRRALLFCSYRHAKMCQDFLHCHSDPVVGLDRIHIFSVDWNGAVSTEAHGVEPIGGGGEVFPGRENLFAVSYPGQLSSEGKAFWQHTGFGISSRRAAYWAQFGPFFVSATIERRVSAPSLSSQYLCPGIDVATVAMRKLLSANHSALGKLAVGEDDVFLYLCGMAAITEVAAAIQAIQGTGRKSPFTAVIFGYLFIFDRRVGSADVFQFLIRRHIQSHH